MSFEYGAPATLTGPCLATTCSENPILGQSVCGSSVQLCTAGSIAFDNLVDAADQGENCSYLFVNNATGQEVACDLQPLSSTLGHSGNIWSLYDASSTVTITPTTPPQGATILFIGNTAISLSYFLAGGAAEATASGNGSAQMTSATSFPASTTSTGMTASQSMASNTGTGSGKSMGTSGASTSALATGTTSASSASTTTTQSGQPKFDAPKHAVLFVEGLLLFAHVL